MEKDIEMSHFDIDQQQEIKEGLQAGLDVSVYAKPEFYAIQMRQIRLGLMAGLPVGIYASDKYDWFQMEEIRLGLEHKIDTNKYADPSVPFDTMRQIREGLEHGIDLSAAGKLPAGELRELRMAACEGIDIRKYIKAGYDEEQLKQIRTALGEALDIDPYINPAQRGASIREIALGLGKNLDVKAYADEQMNWQQMRELRKGLEHRIDISVYNNRMYSWQQMREIRLGLEEHLPVEEYKSFMYTAKEMNKHRLKLMQEAHRANDKNEETGKQCDDFTLMTDGRQMEAFILVSAAGMKIPKNEIMSALEDCGITYGIDEAAIDDIAGNGTQDTMITGGNAYAGRKIESYNIGNAAGTATLLSIGKPDNFDARLKNVEDRMEAVDRELHMLNNIYDEFMEKMKPEERNVNPVYLKVEDAIYTKNKEMSELKTIREQIFNAEELYERGKVVVNGTIYRGTSVYIKGVRWDAGTAHNINIRKNGDSISVYRN